MAVETCRRCPLSVPRQLAGAGSTTARLIVISDYPMAPPNRFTVNQAALLANVYEGLGLNPGTDVYHVCALRCSPYLAKKPVKAGYTDLCREHLQQDLATVSATLVLALGYWATAGIIGADLSIDLGYPLAQLRGRWYEVELGGYIYRVRPTYGLADMLSGNCYHLDDDGNRSDLMVLPGSSRWFWYKDLAAVREALQQK
jgi:uracil-DNA glycosylase family 4